MTEHLWKYFGDIERHVHRAQIGDEIGGVVGIVGAQRATVAAVQTLQHGQPRVALGIPVACVSMASTTRPWRFSISTWPMWQSFEACPRAFLNRGASVSVIEAWAALLRFDVLARYPLQDSALKIVEYSSAMWPVRDNGPVVSAIRKVDGQ
ncbi:hypothetical protein ABIC78_003622 [Novosphingobium sp. 1529]